MTNFAGVFAEAVVQLAMYYYAAADTGAYKHSQRVVSAARGAYLELTIGPGIHVIIDKDRTPKTLRQPRAKREIVEMQVS